ncbi:MAG: prefoldin subunit beta [Candidatus ainarchaeum sp.]|nr:prefoldin subunit beta [Candidatus ainarchaeum sp.]
MQQNNPELEKNLMQYQNLEKQLQSAMLQKNQLQLQVNEIDLAIKELSKTSEEEVFKSIGAIMVKTTKENAQKDLEDRKKMSELRINSLTKQEEQLKSKLDELREVLEASLKPHQGAK